MGDLNAKVGEGADPDCGIGPFGHGTRNARGEMLAAFCKANNLIVTNTLFNQPQRRRYTWVSPLDNSFHQLDYIMTDAKNRSSLINSRARPTADCDTDHFLVIAKIRVKVMKSEKSKPPVRFNLEKLKDPDIKAKYEIETQNRFEILLEDWSTTEIHPNEIWEDMKKAYLESAENVLGRKERKKSKPYISENVKKLAMEKKKARKENRRLEYKNLKSEIRKQIRKEKREWLERECAKLTAANEHQKSKEIFQQISKIKGQNIYIQNQCVKNKEGKTLTEKEEILDRWHTYGKELFDSKEKSKPNQKTFEPEPKPLFEEVSSAIKQLKKEKSPGLDNIPGELLTCSGGSSYQALHHLCVKVWETCQWPTDWKLQEFVMLYKSGDIKDCNNYRTIALISHTSKILLIIILNRMKGKVEAELSDCQAGYRKNRGTVDMLFILQILIEKIRNTTDEAFITFIDYSKAFDSVSHQNLFNTMNDMGFPTHLISLLSNLYDEQKATIRWNGEHCKYFDINKGVRQGCILSPHLFSIYTEAVMRKSDIDDMGIKIGGRNLTNLRYADDTALLANDVTSMKRILYRVDTAGKSANLKLNAKKTKVMHVNGSSAPPKIQINKTDLEYVTHFKYLGSIKSNDGTCLRDIKSRIAMAKQKMVQLNNIWKDRGIPLVLKIKLLKCLIWPVVIYGCEAWTLRKQETDKLRAAEMWFYRRLLTNTKIVGQIKAQMKAS